MFSKPLAEILRPRTPDEYIGQEHLMGKDAILRTAIENKSLHSMILWGPPGVGKTTLALLMAEMTGADFYMLSAISAGVKDIREVFENAKKSEKKTLLFIDEIHRFSKAQQDSLLGAVEQGLVTLIGATTENPSFEVISPLLSRCQVYILKNLDKSSLEQIITHTVTYLEKELPCSIEIKETEALLRVSGGDARKLINAIELSVSTLWAKGNRDKIVLDNDLILKIIQKNIVIYDKKGENHYDIISAFIKSVRGSDPNAAVYWLARMIAAGEDPLFIARRMIILASEDIGNANPNALLLANNCYQAVHHIGMPEGRIVLSQTAVYLASSPKSNASYLAIEEALEWVYKTGDLPVPLHLRNAPTELMKEIGYGQNYKYAHQYEHNFTSQEFLPESISGKKFYEPQENPRENDLRKYLKNCWKNKYNYIFVFLLCCSFFFRLSAQDIHYSQVMASPVNVNPALTGIIDGVFRIGLNQKTQWLSVTKPFITVTAAVDAPVYKNHRRRELIGMGLLLNMDRAGDSHYTTLQPMFAISYVKSLDRRNRHKLSLGIFLGCQQRTMSVNSLNFDEQYQHGYFNPDNPITETFDKTKLFFFDWGAGANWSFFLSQKTSLSAGISLSHLNQPKLSFDGNELARLPVKTQVYVASSFPVFENLFLSPIIYTAFQKKFSEIHFGSSVEYLFKNTYETHLSFGGGLFYRWNDAIIITGLLRWQNFKVGLSYDFNVSTFTRATRVRGGFEVSLQYILKRESVKSAGREPCPFELM